MGSRMRAARRQCLRSPSQVRHGNSRRPVCMAEITLAAGSPASKGGGDFLHVPYSKNVPLARSIRIGSTATGCRSLREGVRINRGTSLGPRHRNARSAVQSA
ncbi:hypothetical protein F2981_21685 (plasmid) [Sinorhizobium meliloti]|nr:hypothetical protein [Sinorhizobium meliloti]